MENEDTRRIRIEKTRDILRNEKFLAMIPAARSKILNDLLAKGLALDDLKMLLAEALQERQNTKSDIAQERAYLEALPYDVFVSIVTQGNLKGAQLISLCDSSKTLRDYCNRSRMVNDEEQSEFLFRLLLAKMGKKMVPEQSPKETYKYHTMYVPMMFKRVSRKLWNVHLFHKAFNLHVSPLARHTIRDIYPKTMFDLFYGGLYTGLLYFSDNKQLDESIVLMQTRNLLYSKFLQYEKDLIPNSNLQFDPTYTELRDKFLDGVRRLFPTDGNLILKKARSNIRVKLQMLRNLYHTKSLQRAETIYDNISRNPEIRALFETYAPVEFSYFANFTTRMRNHQESLRLKKERDAAVVNAEMLVSQMIGAVMMSGVLFNFTDEELYFLVELHRRVLNGELQLEAPFSLELIL